MPPKCKFILTSVLNGHLTGLFGLLRPKERDRTTDLHVRKCTSTVVEQHYHFSLYEVADVTLLIDAARMEPGTDSSCRPA